MFRMHVRVVLHYVEARVRGVSVRPCCWDTVPHWESGFQCLFLSCSRLGFCFLGAGEPSTFTFSSTRQSPTEGFYTRFC